MKVYVTGTRGIPLIPGGVETHCENLYPLIADMGCEVRLSRRSSYVSAELQEWRGVHLDDVYSPKSKSFEAIVHTFLSLIRARRWNADIVHIHAIGPSLLVPFARLLGMKVVMTNHGPDYDRAKWSPTAKKMLQLGEYLGSRFSNSVIVISRNIQKGLKDRYSRDSTLIPNGVTIPNRANKKDFVLGLGLKGDDYLLAVARFVPEKGLLDLIQAYEIAGLDYKLVIAGDSDHEDDYSIKIKELAAKNPDIILTGYVTGNKLAELFSHARCFVLPSYHEGLPIVLLEALSYGLPVIASDIAANLEVEIKGIEYFRCGDIEDLSETLRHMSEHEIGEDGLEAVIRELRASYNWKNIAGRTQEVYWSLMR